MSAIFITEKNNTKFGEKLAQETCNIKSMDLINAPQLLFSF